MEITENEKHTTVENKTHEKQKADYVQGILSDYM